MIRSSIAEGIRRTARRPGLVLLLYGIMLGLAALLAVPVYRIVDLGFGSSGFSPDLAERFDLVVWADWLRQGRAGLMAAVRQFIWVIPLYIVIKVAAYVGLVNALKEDGGGSFWSGVGEYTLRGLALASIYAMLALVGAGALWIVLSAIISDAGQVVTFWIALVIGPLLTVAVLGLVDLMHDYARIRLVMRQESILSSFLHGSFWPLRRLSAIVLYKLWFFAAAVVWLIPFWIDLEFGKTTVWAMIGAFATQQVVILLRQAVSVGWVASEVAYFEEKFVPPPEPLDEETAATSEESPSGLH